MPWIQLLNYLSVLFLICFPCQSKDNDKNFKHGFKHQSADSYLCKICKHWYLDFGWKCNSAGSEIVFKSERAKTNSKQGNFLSWEIMSWLLDAVSALQTWSSVLMGPFNSYESTKLCVVTDVFHVTINSKDSVSVNKRQLGWQESQGFCFGRKWPLGK